MEVEKSIIFRVLMSRFHHGSPEILLKGLSAEDARLIMDQEVHAHNVSAIFPVYQEVVGKIHYSWLPKVIQEFPVELQELIIGSFPAQQGFELSKLMGKSFHEHQLSSWVKGVLNRLIYEKLDMNAILPISFLPPSTLNSLADLNKTELVQLIDFLALQDLAEALKFIVDKKKIKGIYQWLSPRKQTYLKICLHRKDKLALPQLESNKWHDNYDKVGMQLHRRGLHRFARSLSGQHPDLLWYIMHILDSGRGSIISKYYTKESIPGVTPTLTQQLIHLMNFLQFKE